MPSKLSTKQLERWVKQLEGLPKGAPMPTTLRKGLSWQPGQTISQATAEFAGLDMKQLQGRYRSLGVTKPKLAVGSFTAPVDARTRYYEQVRNSCIDKFLRILIDKGWDPVVSTHANSPYRIRIEEGTYPAYDLASGRQEWENMEYRIIVPVVMRHPKYERVEIDPELISPTQVAEIVGKEGEE